MALAQESVFAENVIAATYFFVARKLKYYCLYVEQAVEQQFLKPIITARFFSFLYFSNIHVPIPSNQGNIVS